MVPPKRHLATKRKLTESLIVTWNRIVAWWPVGRFGAFRPKGLGFESRSSRHVRTLVKSFTRSCLWRFGVKLGHSIRAVSGAPLSSIVDLKMRYRSSLNE